MKLAEIEVQQVVFCRRRTIGIVVHNDGTVVVRAPYGTAQAYLEEAVATQRAWIVRTQRRLAARVRQPCPDLHGQAAVFFAGQWRTPCTAPETQKVILRDAQLLFPAQGDRVVQLAACARTVAPALLGARLEALSAALGLQYEQLRIQNARTRWGSCNARGQISLNWKLLLLPPHLCDYVLLHELCHTRVLDHSPRFWGLMAQCCPHYAQLREEMHAFDHWLAWQTDVQAAGEKV